MKIVTMAAAAMLSVSALGFAYAQAPAPARPADLVATRQASFGLLYGTWRGMRAAVAAKVEPKAYILPAKGIAAFGHQMPSLFPPGSGTGRIGFDSIYENRADFEKAAAALAEAGNALVKATQANDAEAFAAGVKQLDEACGGCHTKRFADNWNKQ